MNRQRLLLAILLVIFVLAVVYSAVRFPRQKQVDKLTFVPGSAANMPKGAPSSGQESLVRLDLLQKNQAPFKGFKRNIFAPLFRDMSKLPPVKQVAPPPPPPPPPPPDPQAIEAARIEQELAQFTYLGYLEKEKVKTVFLAQGKDIYVVKIGGKIAGQYEIKALTPEAITLQVLSSGKEVFIPVLENRPLTPSGGSRVPMPAVTRRPPAQAAGSQPPAPAASSQMPVPAAAPNPAAFTPTGERTARPARVPRSGRAPAGQAGE
jgi:hypothetical protein